MFLPSKVGAGAADGLGRVPAHHHVLTEKERCVDPIHCRVRIVWNAHLAGKEAPQRRGKEEERVGKNADGTPGAKEGRSRGNGPYFADDVAADAVAADAARG